MAIPDHVETSALLGRLSWDAIPKEPIVLATFAVVALGGIALRKTGREARPERP